MERIKSYFIYNHDDVNVNIFEVGYDSCKRDKKNLFKRRKYYCLHLVTSGKGIYIVNGKQFSLKTGDLFLLIPDADIDYFPDSEDPWSYYWIGFGGIHAKRLLDRADIKENHPVLHYSNVEQLMKVYKSVLNRANDKGNLDLAALSGFYEIFRLLCDVRSPRPTKFDHVSDYYIKDALSFIEKNYGNIRNINEITHEIGLNQNYFSEIFKQKIGVSPSSFRKVKHSAPEETLPQ